MNLKTTLLGFSSTGKLLQN